MLNSKYINNKMYLYARCQIIEGKFADDHINTPKEEFEKMATELDHRLYNIILIHEDNKSTLICRFKDGMMEIFK